MKKIVLLMAIFVMGLIETQGQESNSPPSNPASFFDDFNGPTFNPIWQASLPDADSAYGTIQYLGAPAYGFQIFGTNTVLRLTNSLNNLQRVGWSSSTNFSGTNFYYEARFNTLNQTPTNSIDAFFEIWLLDAADSSRYDIISPFGGGYDSNPSFNVSSSIDSSYTVTPFVYQNNTWYHLVLQSASGENIRASVYDDNWNELIGVNLGHGAAAYTNGFKIAISQSVGMPLSVYPVDVAVDYVKLAAGGVPGPTLGNAPVIVAQPTNQTAAVGGSVTFNVDATGNAPLVYQWQKNGNNLVDGGNISGSTTTNLTIAAVTLNDAGNYDVVATNSFGGTVSAIASLIVSALPGASFFDNFSGPTLNPIWQASLPDADSAYGTIQYLGAPTYGFQTLGTNTVLRLTNSLNNLQRVGWSSVANFSSTNFYYEARFNTLDQTPANSIDAFFEIWLLDASDSSRYDIISPFGGGYNSNPSFNVSSSIDSSYTVTPFVYQNNTWYHLVLQSASGENIRASIYDDNWNELIGVNLGHGAAAYTNGFKIALSQSVGLPLAVYPVDVAVDYVKLAAGTVPGAPLGYAPVIMAQPMNQTVVAGGTAAFTVTATGTGPLSYLWSFDGNHILGATNSTLILTDVRTAQAGEYSVTVLGVYGTTNSAVATLAVQSPAPVILAQPANRSVPAGAQVVFNIFAEGSLPLSYQWIFNGTNINGATNASLMLFNVQPTQAGIYAVTVSNPYGSVNSTNIVLTVSARPLQILRQPINQSVLVGGTANFSVVVSSLPPLSYVWYFNGTNVVSTNAMLTLTNVQSSQAGYYGVRVSSPYGSTNSANALLTVSTESPVIVKQPVNQSIPVGATAKFSVTATGSAPLSYVWYFNGTNIMGGTNATLVLYNVQPEQSGSFTVTISNPYGSTNSASASLTVSPLVGVSFFDNFDGPTLNPIWQASLPDAGSPNGTIQYLGVPAYGFQIFGTNTVLRLTNSLNNLQRVGWSSSTNFSGTNFYYEARFNTLNQTPTNSIDAFFEIWLLDAADSSRYDIISPFGGGYDSNPSFNVSSSIDSSYTVTPFVYQNNTWYHLVLQSASGQNIRASVFDDNWNELVRVDLSHGASAYSNGFKLAISQSVGMPLSVYPVDVAVDYVKLAAGGVPGPTLGNAPVIVAQPTNQTAAVGGSVTFNVDATGNAPLVYQWQKNGNNLVDGGNISGSTTTNLTIAAVTPNDAGNYDVVVTNSFGGAKSLIAVLTLAQTTNSPGPINTNGIPGLLPQPKLTPVGRTHSGLQLGWTLGAGTFQVETAPSPVGPWTPIVLPLITNGNSVTVSVTPTNLRQFFRLVGQ